MSVFGKRKISNSVNLEKQNVRTHAKRKIWVPLYKNGKICEFSHARQTNICTPRENIFAR
jgi:hypothetical protein